MASPDFGSTAHHGIFRDLVERETYDAHHDRRYRISDVTVNADNNSTRVSLSHTGSYLRVRIGDPNTSYRTRVVYADAIAISA